MVPPDPHHVTTQAPECPVCRQPVAEGDIIAVPTGAEAGKDDGAEDADASGDAVASMDEDAPTKDAPAVKEEKGGEEPGAGRVKQLEDDEVVSGSAKFSRLMQELERLAST
jgi:hypothetical protein